MAGRRHSSPKLAPMNESQEVATFDIGLADRPPARQTGDAQASALVPAVQAAARQTRQIGRLAVQLGLAPFLHSHQALRSELQKIVFALHPDKSGGEFANERHKSQFMKARSLVELLDAEANEPHEADGATPLPRSARAITDGRNLRRTVAAQCRLQMRVLADTRRRIAGYFAVPKIVSGTLAPAFTATLLTQNAGNNPLLGSWLALPWVQGPLWLITGSSALAFALLWLIERSALRRAEHLMSEAALPPIFDRARLCADRHGRAGKLSTWDVRQAIETLVPGSGERAGRLAGWNFLGALDFTTLDRIAMIQMQRLIDRRVLRELHTPSIEVLYEVSPLAWQS